jgi:tRNA A-37 threonylcarbamoyl transferase component Bud32
MSIKTNIQSNNIIQLDKFIENLIKDLKYKYKKKQLNISNKSLENFNNYIKKKLSTQNFDNNLSYILDKLQNKLNNKQLERFKNIDKIITRINYFEYNKTPFKKIIQNLKNNLPKLKVYDNCSDIKYKKTDIIGQGVSGKVFLIDKYPDKILKNINITNYNIDEGFGFNTLNSLINEILIMEKLNDTNISPKLYEYFLCTDKNNLILSLVQEKMDMSLSNWLDNGNILNYSHKKQLIDKIQKLHNLDIAHKDIHSGNILIKKLDDSIDLYIADFGISKYFNNIIEDYKKYDINNINDLFYSIGNNNNKIIITLICLLNILVII